MKSNQKIFIHFLILIFSFILLIKCGTEETVLNNEELIFPNSFPISIGPYTYEDAEGNEYFIRRDTNILLPPDTVNSTPVFAWDTVRTRYITIGIFRNPIRIYGNEIVNLEDLIWQWHSGMNFEKTTVQFSEGRNVLPVENEIGGGISVEIDYENEPDPLSVGQYYWAIWAWGTGGVKILYSSSQRELYVIR